jgi:hypothetical protein
MGGRRLAFGAVGGLPAEGGISVYVERRGSAVKGSVEHIREQGSVLPMETRAATIMTADRLPPGTIEWE